MTGARAPLYPVSLVVEGRSVLVVGGGHVAARKAAALAECGAEVTVVAPEVTEPLGRLARGGTVALERRPYERGEAAAHRLVVAATGVPEVDRAVAADAEAAGIWVNVADDAKHCSFLLPAVARDGSVSVAVSTAGTSPALAVWLRDRIAHSLPAGLGELAGVLDGARRRLRASGRPTEPVDWRAIFDARLLELVASGQLAEAQQLVADRLGRPAPAGD